ncbi:sulfatase-like hydrolase/transferase [Thalassotalea litorea]|uniref:sulfatase-like hydrolase/transferase n=1 Tax=Thalassotalea litorea TaxID=2020715 RepID=UPI003735A468
MKLVYIFFIGLLLINFSVNAQTRPNIVYINIDNIGFGDLSSYDGGLTRGASTPNIDKLAQEGFKLWNFAPESQCTPSRSALMTGRYSIRSGTHTVALAGTDGGLVQWEKTIAETLSEVGYATAIMGKWHIGASEGRWPTDQGFDIWYGPAHSWDEALWADDPWYKPERDGISYMYEGKKGKPVETREKLSVDLKVNLDVAFLERSKKFMKAAVSSGKPFYLYFNHTLMHMPVIPRDEFKGKSGRGDNADALLQLDADVASLMQMIDELGQRDNTIVVFAGENGPEHMEPWRGDAGRFTGSYFSGSEGNLRTPFIIRYPGVVPEGKESNEIVHITDTFTTLVKWAGGKVPDDRVIDGADQRAFLEGKTGTSARQGFPYWMGETMYGVKWQNFKVVFVRQMNLAQPKEVLATPHLINLDVDPKEQKAYDFPYLHTWVMKHVAEILTDFEASQKREPFIPQGAPLNYVPGASDEN